MMNIIFDTASGEEWQTGWLQFCDCTTNTSILVLWESLGSIISEEVAALFFEYCIVFSKLTFGTLRLYTVIQVIQQEPLLFMNRY